MGQNTPTLPPTFSVGGVPLITTYDDRLLNAANLLAKSSVDSGEIHILTTLPYSRQVRTVLSELAYQLLYAAGLDDATCERLQPILGVCLHNTLRENSLDWVRDFTQPLPHSIRINGIVYNIRTDKDEYLDAKKLSGECAYDDAEILLDSTLPTVTQRVIACHEIVHALLYESGYEGMNDERLVKPLGYFLYLFLRDNDFNFVRGW